MDGPSLSNMSKFSQLIVLLMLNLHIAVPKPTESPDHLDSPRIINGRMCEIGRFPFAVQYYRRLVNRITKTCGGSLLTYEWVLSAAHCYFTPVKVVKTIVVAGTSKHHLRVGYSGGIVKKVIKHVIHPGYTKDAVGTPIHDILLAKLKSPFQKDHPWIKPVKLPQPGFTSNATKAVVTGWGQQTRTNISTYVLETYPEYFHNLDPINDSRPIVDALMCAEVPVAQYHECHRNFPDVFTIVPSHICTKPYDQKGPCYGDSGGPLAVKNTIIGVVSAVVGCGQHSFAIYMRVDKYYDFIHEHIESIAVPEESEVRRTKKTHEKDNSRANVDTKSKLWLVMVLSFCTLVLSQSVQIS